MKYNNIKCGVFLKRPNRFIAICLVDGEEQVCHVKNTGRCRELLIEGCRVYLQESDNPARKTKHDLVAVIKGDKLFNIDSYAPNTVFNEWLRSGALFDDISLLRPETTYNNSRFDFYVEHGAKKTFIEVKGVTLERDGVLMFPDAPTERGVKHIHELCRAVEEGYEAYIAFVVQTDGAKYFTPNRETHPQLADALLEAEKKGVRIICLSCRTSPDTLEIDTYVPIRL